MTLFLGIVFGAAAIIGVNTRHWSTKPILFIWFPGFAIGIIVGLLNWFSPNITDDGVAYGIMGAIAIAVALAWTVGIFLGRNLGW